MLGTDTWAFVLLPRVTFVLRGVGTLVVSNVSNVCEQRNLYRIRDDQAIAMNMTDEHLNSLYKSVCVIRDGKSINASITNNIKHTNRTPSFVPYCII